MKFWPKLRRLMRRRKAEAEMSEEIRLHLELQTERNIAAGMDPNEARYAARRAFGGVEQVKERCREQRTWVALELFARELGFAIRQLTRRRGLTAVVLATLAICLGANAALFSLVRSTLLQPYPYPEADRVVNLGMMWRKMQWGDMVQEISPRVFLDLEQSATSFAALGYVESGVEADVHWGGGPIRVRSALVSAGVWDVARVPALLGRTFSKEDVATGGRGSVVLSYDLWRGAFNGAPDVIGTRVRIDDEVCEVIGVMPRGFSVTDNRTQLWRPKVFTAWERSEDSRGAYAFQAIGRLRGDVSVVQVRQELAALHRAYVRQHPEAAARSEQLGESYGAVPLTGWVHERASGAMFVSVQIAAGLVLLLGCLNIAGVVALHAQRRTAELTLRHAFGATPARLVRQFVVEALVLFAAGGVLAAFTGWGATNFLRAHFALAETTPFGQSAGFDLVIVAGTVLVAMLAGAVVGAVPAHFAVGRDLNAALQTSGGRATTGWAQRRLQSFLVTLQIGLAVVLLAAAVVTVRNLRGLLQEGFGVAVEDRVVASVALPRYRYGAGAEATTQRINPFKQRALLALENVPGVRNVTVANRVPLSVHRPTKSGFGVPGYTPASGDPWPIAFTYQVGPSFFQTLGITLLRGRDFGVTDVAAAEPVAIISEQIAHRYYPAGEAVGSHIFAQGRSCRIIGIASEMRSVPLNFGDAAAIYLPIAQWPALDEDCSFVVHGASSGGSLAAAVTKTLSTLDPALTVRTTSLAAIQGRAVLTQSAPMEVVGFFAVLAVALMALGLYGVLASLVAQRTREFGVRIALGARPGAVFGQVFGRGAILAGWGIAIGAGLALPSLHALRPLLADQGAAAPDVIVGAAGLVSLVVALACYWPARAATKVDPIVALRCE